MSLLHIYSHFHTDFPFNYQSNWFFATYSGGKEPYEWIPPNNYGKFINVNSGEKNKCIDNYRNYYINNTENEFLNAMGQQATEYWLYKNTPTADFIGCTTYRRYLLFSNNVPQAKIQMVPTIENCKNLTSQEQYYSATKLLETNDVIVNHEKDLGQSIEQQYLYGHWHEVKEFYDLFIQGILEFNPDYRKKISWFQTTSKANFETCYVMRRDIFRKYSSELFEILEFVFQNCEYPYFVNDGSNPRLDPKPWRWPGFLGERFLPFFLYANDIKKINVPLILLE